MRFYRRRVGMSLEDVGKLVGVTRETIRRLEERDTWLDTDRADQIGKALSVPLEVLGFSYATDAYSSAAKALPVVGSITSDDKVQFEQTGRRVAGGAHLPAGSVALDINQGKMRGWLLVYREEAMEPISQYVLLRQGQNENFSSHLADGTTWWRHIKPAAKQGFYHLNSRYLEPLDDVQMLDLGVPGS
nr:helix-turn-helix transcriptional regulator [Bradyrhizobium symbiodeficiens]